MLFWLVGMALMVDLVEVTGVDCAAGASEVEDRQTRRDRQGWRWMVFSSLVCDPTQLPRAVSETSGTYGSREA